MREISIVYSRTKLDIMALTLLVTAEICFYRIGTLHFYFLMTGFGIVVGLFVAGIRYVHRYVNMKSFPVWLIAIYGMFVINGFFRLQIGTFTWDTIIYRFVENIAMYFLFRDIIREDNRIIVFPFIIAGLFSFGYLMMTEGTSFFFTGYYRIGNSMSGNVNTVGYNFGMISLFTMWWYCQRKKWYKLVLFLLFSVVMLLTGSKKVMILLLLDFVLLFLCDREHSGRWLKFALALVALVYLVFNVPVFYDTIGHRIETMLSTMLYGSSATLYSYSTDVRNKMIEEGFKLFLKKPIFGGGWANYYANTTTSYTYSHNNYIELLCSFGLVGTLLYYNKHISNLFYTLKGLVKSRFSDRKLFFPFILILATVLLDFAAISFSAVCVWYIPLICGCVMVEDIKYQEQSEEIRK